MESIAIVLILLAAVVASGVISRAIPIALPLPLVQIALGAAIGMTAHFSVDLDPELFFLLFLPPLLFLDGWQIPKEGLLRDKAVILELALGLVIFTVLGMGFFIHWMIPTMPLAVAFALAAIISPTDPIAVSAIAARVPIPNRLMHILEGESLLNDASGLVCMHIAVLAALTGSFSLLNATGSFLWLATGGVAVGVALTWAVMRAKDLVVRRLGEDPGAQILLTLLIPFAAYVLGEHIGASGILAAVAAGITMSYAEVRGTLRGSTRVRRAAVWETVQFAMNGVIFVLLGEQLPGIISRAADAVHETGHLSPVWLVVYVLAICAALITLRLAWVWISLRFTLYRAARRGQEVRRPHGKLVLVMALAGVRGAITLAGILTLPLVTYEGLPFPARDLAIFLAAGVILGSLVVASVSLPLLLRGLEMPPETEHLRQEDDARLSAASAAIRAVETAQHDLGRNSTAADLYTETGARLMSFYRARIDGLSATGEARDMALRNDRIDRELRLAGLRGERAELQRLARIGRLPDDIARKLLREIDLMESRLGG